jgi:hypothetical protein
MFRSSFAILSTCSLISNLAFFFFSLVLTASFYFRILNLFFHCLCLCPSSNFFCFFFFSFILLLLYFLLLFLFGFICYFFFCLSPYLGGYRRPHPGRRDYLVSRPPQLLLGVLMGPLSPPVDLLSPYLNQTGIQARTVPRSWKGIYRSVAPLSIPAAIAYIMQPQCVDVPIQRCCLMAALPTAAA